MLDKEKRKQASFFKNCKIRIWETGCIFPLPNLIVSQLAGQWTIDLPDCVFNSLSYLFDFPAIEPWV